MNLQDISLLISFVTSPSEECATDFFSDNFENPNAPIFKTYRDKIFAYLKSNDTAKLSDLKECLFNPRGYLLFGRFDLLLLTLTDDIEFATRNFRPYSTTEPTDPFTYKDFDFQVFSTLTPGSVSVDNFIDKYKKITSKDFQISNPFISISQLKINPSLLIGNGINYLDNILEEVVKIINTENITDNEHKIEYLYTINLGSHEIVLMLFSSSTKLISNLIYKVRELSVLGLKDVFKINSVLNEFSDSNIENISNMDNHVFVDTISNFGVTIDYINSKSNQVCNLDIDNLKFSTKWFVKPGHFTSAYNSIKKELTNLNKDSLITLNPNLSLGRGDLILQAEVEFKTINYFNEYVAFLNNKNFNKEIIQNIRESITSVSFKLDEKVLFSSMKGCKHEYLMGKWAAEKYTINANEIQSIVSKLKIINSPKILAEKITSICNVFNNVIQDPVLFGSFIELEAYIKIQIIKKIDQASNQYKLPYLQQKTNREWIQELRANAVIFEHAFYDRFFQTHRTADLTDINLDYKGAIHQLLSTYDALFKFFSYQIRLNTSNFKFPLPPYKSRFFSFIAPQVVYISDEIGIKSTRNSLRINQQHLFQPYIYLSVFIHEVCNFTMNSILRYLNKYDEKKYLKYSKYFNDKNFPDKQLYKCNDENYFNLKEKIKVIVDSQDNKNIVEIFNNLIEHEDYFAYLYVDVLTFSVSFNRNIEQYQYWHINYLLLQANHLHNNIHSISKKNYALIFFRLYMVYLISGNDIKDSFFTDIVKQIPDFYIKNKQNFIVFLKDVKAFAELIYNDKSLKEFFSIINEINNNIYKDFDLDNNLDSQLISYSYSNNDELDKFKTRVDEFINLEVKDDRIYKSKLLDVIRHYIYIFHAYNGSQNNDLIHVIERDKETGRIAISPEDKDKVNIFADFCFDSQGGMFTTSATIRRKIHLARSYVFIALWDFTQKYKKEYF